MPPDFSSSGSGSGSGSGSAPAHSAIFTAHTSQEVFTAPAWHFSVQVQTAGASWASPSSIRARRSASSTWFRKWTVCAPSSSRSMMR